MIVLFNKLNVYIFIWFVYYLFCFLWWDYNSIRQLISGVALVVSFYYFFLVNFNYKLPSLLLGLNALILMFSIYGFYLIFASDNKSAPNYDYLNAIYRSLLPIYAFYFLSKRGYFTKKAFYFWIIIFFLLAVVEFYGNQKRILLAALQIGSKRTEFANNIGYFILALFPIIPFLYKKVVLQYSALVFCIFFLLLSMKRGAIIIGVFCLIIFLWKSFVVNGAINVSKKNIITLLLIAIMVFVSIQYQMESSEFFQERIDDTLAGDSSKRNDLYSTLINYFWNETTPLKFIFGSGANATLNVSYNYAHNDWLELAVNQGFLGMLVYLMYWILFAKEAFFTKNKASFDLAFKMLFIIYFMKTFFSMSYNAMALPAVFILGHCLAQGKDE